MAMNREQQLAWNILQNKPIANPIVNIEDNGLHCPYCKGPYLSQFAYEIFDRKAEDSKDGVKVTFVTGTDTSINHNADVHTDNPSIRNQGLVIKFACDSCEEQPELTIAQEKGETIMKWREFV